jgi:CBS domain-containing protein
MGRIRIRDIIEAETKKVVSVPPHLSLLDAARELSTRRVGTVVVTDDQGDPIGILSERDVTRAFAEHGANAINVTVAEQMSKNLVICEEREDPYVAVWLMHAYDVRHLPITANGRLKAVISSRDVLRYLSDHGSPEEQASLWERRPSRFET